MSIIGLDNFVDIGDVALTMHIPDIGGGWTKQNLPAQSSPPMTDVFGGFLQSRSPNGGPDLDFYTLNIANVSDVSVKATIFSFNLNFCSIFARYTDPIHCVELGPNPGSIDSFLFRSDAGITPISLTQNPAGMELKIVLSGTSAKAYIDGVLKATHTTALGAGKVGIRTLSNIG